LEKSYYGKYNLLIEMEAVRKGQAGAKGTRECLKRESSRKPDAGNPHVRFDEGEG